MLDGKVACPYCRDRAVDVEVCYRCSHLRAFYDGEAGTTVVCSAPRPALERFLGSLGARLRRRI